MLDHHPPRRDPRLLVFDLRGPRVRHVVLDVHEYRALGTAPRAVLGYALLRLLAQVHPTHVVWVGECPEPVVAALSARGLVPLPLTKAERHRLVRQSPRLGDLRVLHPELVGVDLRRLAPLVRLAAVVLTTELPSRRYVSRLSPRSKATLASRRPRGAASP